MAWYFDEDSKASVGGSDHPPSSPKEVDYTDDVSRVFISLNSSIAEVSSGGARARGGGGGGGSGCGGGGGDGRGRARAGRGQGNEAAHSPQSSGALSEYFSSLFDESFCSHNFKLVGSRIFSSGRFQEEEAANARDLDISLDRAMSSSGSVDRDYLGSSGSSSELLRTGSSSQMSDGEPWGWFDEMDDVAGDGGGGHAATPPVMKATPPYILTESLSTQKLWRETAGKRPRQPSQERDMYEQLWAKNFSDSEVDYSAPLRESSASARKRARKRKTAKVLYRATSPFGSAVSKSFQCDNCGQITSIMVHIPKFQIVQTGSDVHAEYLIVVGLGAVTLGVWRRFTEFKRLASKLASSSRRDQFHNALCSWRCLRERQRWFRCLDRDYLILKTFLLERFLHDFVFESISPNTVRDFLGVL